MNPIVEKLFTEYLHLTEQDRTAAASLALADVFLSTKPVTLQEDVERALSVQDAAKSLHVSPNTVYNLCIQGLLTHHRVGRAIRIRPLDIEEYQMRMAKVTRRPSLTHKLLRL